MTLRRRFRLWLLVLIELSVAAVAVALEELWILMLAGPVVAASWYLAESHLRIVLPRTLVNVGGCTALVLVTLSAVADPDPGRGMSLLASFVLALIVLRQLQDRTTREDAQQIVLAAVLMIASTMQTTQLLFGIILFCWIGVGVYVIILFQLYAGADGARGQRDKDAPDRSPVLPPLPVRFGPKDVADVRVTSAISFVIVILVSILVFIFFPRQLLFRSGLPGGGPVARSEFVQTVDLITNARINNSRREVFSLEWISPDGEAMQWNEPILMRGAVLDEYDPELDRWVSAPTMPRDRRVTHFEMPVDGFLQIGISPINEQFYTYTARVTMRSMASDVAFAPWAPVAIASAPRRQFELDRRTLIITESTASMVGSYSSYQLRVQPFASDAAMQSLIGSSDPPKRVVSFPITEVRELALAALEERKESLDRLPDESKWQRNIRVAEALEKWLELRCEYTIDLGDFIQVSGEDPIVSFISRYQFGHCEYFASALTAMCLSLGVESRLVTGYVAIEYLESTSSYIVRDSNAHAWTEVRTGDYQWESLDPSPLADLEEIQVSNRSWADRWRWMYDRLDYFWNSTIVAFDQRSQKKLTNRLSGGWKGFSSQWLEWISEQLGSVNSFFRFGVAGYVWMGSIFLIMIAFVLAMFGVLRRRHRAFEALGADAPDSVSRRRLAANLMFWIEALRLMSRRGLVKSPGETPLAFAQRTATVDPLAGSTLSELARAMYHIRFGGHDPTREEVEQLTTRAKSLRRGSSND